MDAKLIHPLYLCAYVPEFPAQTLLRLRPELTKVAVAVIEGSPPLEKVCSANLHARRLGVLNGMTRVALASFSTLLTLRRSLAEEKAARDVLLDTAAKYTPSTEIYASGSSAFAMVLDMTGTSSIFGPTALAASNISRSFKAISFTIKVAVSSNVHVARCVAPSANKEPAIIPEGREKEYLQFLPLSALNLTLHQLNTLELWGLQTLGDLAAISEVEVVVRLGQEGKRLRLLARGEQPHLFLPEEQETALQEFLAFDSPVVHIDSLLFVLGPMLDQLVARAQRRALSLASVSVMMGLDGGGEHKRTIRPALPVAQRTVLLKLLQLDLQKHPPPAGVLSLSVQAEPGKQVNVQMGLFSPQVPEPTRMDVTLARIAALVGEERVGRVKLLDSHRAECFKMERFTVPTAHIKQNEHKVSCVALRRCRPPWMISIQCKQNRPYTFIVREKRYIVKFANGPWRTSGEWWSPDVWSREEWDVHAETVASETLICIVTHDLLSHCWQIEALYD